MQPPKRIYLSSPHMGTEERRLLMEAFDSNWIAPLGPHVDGFEKELAQTVGMPHAAALSSGTAALHLALILLGVGPGDEVMVSSLTFSASVNPILYQGATPVFIDSETASWNLDPNLLAAELHRRAAVNRLPKALIGVDLYGQCADWAPIQEQCRKYGVPIIEDAAEALGASYRGRSAGSFGDLNVFSFNGNKIITTSGGGMLVSENKAWIEKARFLATQARDPAPHYQHSQVGYNYRLSNLLAAVGRGQLQVLSNRVAARRANFAYYQRVLSDLPGITFMPELSAGQCNRWLTCVQIDPARFGASREEIRVALEARNIESRPVWKPMHMQPIFSRYPRVGGEVAERLFEFGLCLPSGSNLAEADLGLVVEAIRATPRKAV